MKRSDIVQFAAGTVYMIFLVVGPSFLSTYAENAPEARSLPGVAGSLMMADTITERSI